MSCGGCRQGKTVPIFSAEEIKAPVINSDGSIQYPESQEVPTIQGYHLDEDNSHRLIPEEACGCVHKITGILLQKNGTFNPHYVCNHAKCEHRSKPVSMAICRECSFRETF